MVLNVKVGTVRKNMLSTCKNRLRQLLRVHLCMKRWISRRSPSMKSWRRIYFSWNWSWNPYSVEDFRFCLFSAIWDCLHCTPSMHTGNLSHFGQRHGLQSITLTSYFYKNIYLKVIYVYFYESTCQDKSIHMVFIFPNSTI
jgi:hypothetical protein